MAVADEAGFGGDAATPERTLASNNLSTHSGSQKMKSRRVLRLFIVNHTTEAASPVQSRFEVDVFGQGPCYPGLWKRDHLAKAAS